LDEDEDDTHDHGPHHVKPRPALSRTGVEALSCACFSLVEVILRSRPHLEQGFRSCVGILRQASTATRRFLRNGVGARVARSSIRARKGSYYSMTTSARARIAGGIVRTLDG
jgi:hypothetical protein